MSTAESSAWGRVSSDSHALGSVAVHTCRLIPINPLGQEWTCRPLFLMALVYLRTSSPRWHLLWGWRGTRAFW